MSNESENTGYVVEGRLSEATRGYLVLWSIGSALLPYSEFAETARARGLDRSMLPSLRKPRAAFAYSKDVIQGIRLETLSELEGWDGLVSQQIKVNVLRKRDEYQISILRKGRMRGKKHSESIPVMRMSWSPPEGFNAQQWIVDYENSFWDDETMRPRIEEINQCVSVEPYWDETEIDAGTLLNLRNRVESAFRSYATGVDSDMLRRSTAKAMEGLGAVAFLSGRGVSYVAKEVNGEETLPTLEAFSEIISVFSRRENSIDGDYYDADGNVRVSSIRKSNLRILGYLDGERELEYIRSDIGDTLSMECGQYWAQVVKTAEAFNDENVEAFEKKLSELQVKRDGLRTRIASITESIGGGVNVRGELPPDLDRRLNLRVQGITANRVVQRIRELAVV